MKLAVAVNGRDGFYVNIHLLPIYMYISAVQLQILTHGIVGEGYTSGGDVSF